MNNISQFLKSLRDIDNNISDFLKSEASSNFYIIDIEGQSFIDANCYDPDKCFSIKNQNNEEIFFIPIDGKDGLLGFGESYCDATIFSKKYFCFLEFKFNATSITDRAIRKNRKKAISQLSNTIDYFDIKLNRNYSGLSLEAYVSTPPKYPRKDTAWVNFEVEFLEEYGMPLFETNEKTF
ncbi:MAG: hypothetical protein K9H64_23215 [Bacteroidales bacterium]|nr:hypothetical protein [Bacteroidales bacterium]MCF8458941.1 hypothetical protein [Bacteroidales bacterium]